MMFSDLAAELVRLGHEVTVVTGDEALRARYEISQDGAVTVLRVKSGRARHPSRVMRVLNERRFSRIIWAAGRHFFERHPSDLVVYYSPTIFWGGLVRKLKRLNNASTYLVLRDLFPQWAVDAGLLSRHGIAYRYFKHHESKLYGSADVIGVQSPANLDYFSMPQLRGRYNVEVLFNWTSLQEPAPSSLNLRGTLGLANKVIFVYGGNLGVAQDLDNVLRLANKLKDQKELFFLLVGDGSEYQRIRNQIERGRMQNVKLLPSVSPNDFYAIVSQCDVGLISLRHDLRTQNFPGKMLSYMKLRKPMLASINPGNDLKTLLHDYNAGLACDNGEDGTFCEYALELARDSSLRLSMGANAHRLLSDKFNVTRAAQQILAHF
jgi:glycosyltransferase involved in cell wall biosynthesis